MRLLLVAYLLLGATQNLWSRNALDSLPQARPDSVLAEFSSTISWQVLVNDSYELLDTLLVVIPPNLGQAYFLQNGELIYQPGDADCQDLWIDELQYVLCGRMFCDTTHVYFELSCAEIQVFNGFSPNGDGVNDYFVINGLERFSTHHLLVYNRWGNLVYESKGYLNDWEGTWNGKALPTGTYYYILEFDGNRVQRGALELRR